MAYRVQLQPGAQTAIAKALKDKAAIVVRREAARIADEAVAEAQKLARQDLYTDRPASRRRSPGSPRYVNGFSAKVEGSSFPFRVTLSNRSKVAKILESGRSDSIIRPRGSKLVIPVDRFEGGRPVYSPHASAYGSSTKARQKVVVSPGNDGYKIMERALRAAFRNRGASVRATR